MFRVRAFLMSFTCRHLFSRIAIEITPDPVFPNMKSDRFPSFRSESTGECFSLHVPSLRWDSFVRISKCQRTDKNISMWLELFCHYLRTTCLYVSLNRHYLLATFLGDILKMSHVNAGKLFEFNCGMKEVHFVEPSTPFWNHEIYRG